MNTKKQSSIYDSRYKALINQLMALRKEAGLSQAQLAAKLGLSQSDISKIEICERRLDLLEALDWIKVITGTDEYRGFLSLIEQASSRADNTR